MEDVGSSFSTRSITRTISSLNRSLDIPPVGYLSVFRLLAAKSEQYVKDAGESWNDLLVLGLSCVLRIGEAKGPVRRRALEFLHALLTEASGETVLNLCRDLKELVYKREASTLGIEDKYVVVAALAALLPRCPVSQKELAHWMFAMLDKRQLKTLEEQTHGALGAAVVISAYSIDDEKIIDKATSAAAALWNENPDAAAFLIYRTACSGRLSVTSREKLLHVSCKGMRNASILRHVQLWATVLCQIEPPLKQRPSFSRPQSFMESVVRPKKPSRKASSILDPLRAIWNEIPFNRYPAGAYWVGVFCLEQVLADEEEAFLIYEVLNALSEEIEANTSNMTLVSEMVATALQRANSKESLTSFILVLADVVGMSEEIPAVRAIGLATLSILIRSIGMETFSGSFLVNDLVSSAVHRLGSGNELERVTAASLLAAIVAGHRTRRNAILIRLVDDLRADTFNGPLINMKSSLGKAAAICLLLDEASEDDLSNFFFESIATCAIGCIANDCDTVDGNIIFNMGLRRAGWAMISAAARLRGDRIFTVERLEVLVPLWREDFSGYLETLNHKKSSSSGRTVPSNLRCASLCALMECLRSGFRDDWLLTTARSFLGAAAARLLASGTESLWKDKAWEVVQVLKCCQLITLDGAAFHACYQLAFLAVREARSSNRIESATILSTIHSLGSTLPLILSTTHIQQFRSVSGSLRSDLVRHFLSESMGVSVAEVLGEGAEAIGALLCKDVDAALTFLLSIAEAPSLAPSVDAALSLAIVRRLHTTDLGSVSNAGRVTSSVQVLLRRALNNLTKVSSSVAKKLSKMEQALQSWRCWNPFREVSSTVATTIALAYQALGEKGGDILVSGLIDRAQNIVSQGLIANQELAQAVFAVIGTLMNTVGPEKQALASKIVRIIEDALSSNQSQLRLAAAAAINHTSSSIADSGEALLTFLIYAMAQGSSDSEPHMIVDRGVVRMVFEGSPEAVIVTAVGTKAVLSACKENRLMLPESTVTIAYEIVCEILLWNGSSARKARAAGLKCLELLWEAIVEQYRTNNKKGGNIPPEKFFPRDLPQKVSMRSILRALQEAPEEDDESVDAAAGALLVLGLGAGPEVVLNYSEDFPMALFLAASNGCELAYSCLETLILNMRPERIRSWIKVCDTAFQKALLNPASKDSRHTERESSVYSRRQSELSGYEERQSFNESPAPKPSTPPRMLHLKVKSWTDFNAAERARQAMDDAPESPSFRRLVVVDSPEARISGDGPTSTARSDFARSDGPTSFRLSSSMWAKEERPIDTDEPKSNRNFFERLDSTVGAKGVMTHDDIDEIVPYGENGVRDADDGEDFPDDDQADDSSREESLETYQPELSPFGWRTRAAALSLLEAVVLECASRPDCLDELCAEMSTVIEIVKISLLYADYIAAAAVNGVKLLRVVGAFMIDSHAVLGQDRVLHELANFTLTLKECMLSRESPELVCTSFWAIAKLYQCALKEWEVLGSTEFLSSDIFEVNLNLKLLVSQDWAEVVKSNMVLSVLASTASFVSSLILTEGMHGTQLWQFFEESSELHSEVYLAVCADTCAMVADGPTLLATKGGALTYNGALPSSIEAVYKANVGNIIAAAILLHDLELKGERLVKPDAALSDLGVEWQNTNSAGVRFVRSQREQTETENLLLVLLTWALSAEQDVEDELLAEKHERAAMIATFAKCLERVVTTWEGVPWDLVGEALRNLEMIDNRASLEICFTMQRHNRLNHAQKDVLTICGKSFLNCGQLPPEERREILRMSFEVIFGLLELEDLSNEVIRSADPMKLESIDFMTEDAFSAAFPEIPGALILDLVQRAADVELAKQLSFSELEELVQMTCEIALERLTKSTTHVELLTMACIMLAEGVGAKYKEKVFGVWEPVLRMADQILSEHEASVCEKLLTCRSVRSFLLRIMETPNFQSSILIDLLAKICSIVGQRNAASQTALGFLIEAHLRLELHPQYHAKPGENGETPPMSNRRKALVLAAVPPLLNIVRGVVVVEDAAKLENAKVALAAFSLDDLADTGLHLADEDVALLGTADQHIV